MVLDLRLSKDWDVEMTSFLFFTLFPTLFWTALRPIGTIWNYLERAKRIWNASGLGTREALMELRAAPMERPLGLWNARSATGTIWNYLKRAERYWNCRKALAALVLFVGRR